MRFLLLCSIVGLVFSSSSNNKCNFWGPVGNVLPTGVCYSTGVSVSGKVTCDPANPTQAKLLTSRSPDCPSGSTETTIRHISILNPLHCGGSDCYTSLSAYSTADCTGTSFSAGFYAGGEFCQNSQEYYCDARGFYIYLYVFPGTCIGNWGRIVIHDTGCQTTDLSSYGIPSFIKSFRFGNCKSVNPPPGSFQLQINYHTAAQCASGSEAIAFEFPLLQLGCFGGKYRYFCASDGFYKYEYASGSGLACNDSALEEVAHLPNGCLVDFTTTLISGVNFGSVSFQCLSGGPAPKPIAFGATVEASNVKVYADSSCTQEIRQVYAKTGMCRPMTELETSNVFPTVTTASASGYYKVTCTSAGFQIDARYPNNQCSGTAPESKSSTLGGCLPFIASSGAKTIYVSVLQCQTNLQVATPQAVSSTNGGFIPSVLFVWGVVLVGVVFSA